MLGLHLHIPNVAQARLTKSIALSYLEIKRMPHARHSTPSARDR